MLLTLYVKKNYCKPRIDRRSSITTVIMIIFGFPEKTRFVDVFAPSNVRTILQNGQLAEKIEG